MTFPFRTQSSHLTSLLPSHTPLCLISLSSTPFFRIILTEYTKSYVPLLLLSQICPISLLPKLCAKHESLAFFEAQTVISQPRHYYRKFCCSKCTAQIAPSVTNFPQQIYSNSPLVIDMQSPSGTHQENPIATTSNIVPGLATPVFQPTYPNVGPTP